MKFALYDCIQLNREIEELATHGIHSGCRGVIAKLGEEKSLVLFFNPEDLGDYAYAMAENKDLLFLYKMPELIKSEMAEKIASQDPAKKPSFLVARLREYDMVRVCVEKPKYAQNGVHKGMVGSILEGKKITGCWSVYFPDESGADTICCSIQETDLELVHRSGGTTDESGL